MVGNAGAIVAGDVISITIDMTAQGWFRKNGGVWRGVNNAGTDDPNTGSGGCGIGGLGYHPVVGFGGAGGPVGVADSGIGDNITINLGTTPFA